MNEIDKSYIQRFVDDPQMVESVKKVFELNIKEHLPEVNKYHYQSNEELGEILRAINEALKILEKTFNKLAEFKGSKPEKNKINLAR